MSTKEDTRNVRIVSGWIIILLVACLVYTTGISHESIWYDEAYSDAMAGHSPWEILTLVPYDNHPPLYYLLLSLVQMFFGNSEWALRALFVLGAVGLVSLGAGPVRRIFGDKTAFMYAAVVMFTPAILIYAHEARMYTLAICALTAGRPHDFRAIRPTGAGAHDRKFYGNLHAHHPHCERSARSG
jgi:4-amino-4-deoxy-L-arabinose transferase-like glycosyltransferase